VGDLVAYRAGSRDEPGIGRGIEAWALRGTCVPFDNMHLPGQISIQLSSTSEQSMRRQVTTATADTGVSLTLRPPWSYWPRWTRGRGPRGRSPSTAQGGSTVKGLGKMETEFPRKGGKFRVANGCRGAGALGRRRSLIGRGAGADGDVLFGIPRRPEVVRRRQHESP
jgi:hypothetical protein